MRDPGGPHFQGIQGTAAPLEAVIRYERGTLRHALDPAALAGGYGLTGPGWSRWTLGPRNGSLQIASNADRSRLLEDLSAAILAFLSEDIASSPVL